MSTNLDLAILETMNFETVEVGGDTFGLCNLPSKKGSIDIVKFSPNTVYEPHVHEHSDALVHILYGSGKIILGDESRYYRKGDMYEVPRGIAHGFTVKDETYLLSFQSTPIRNPKTGEFDLHHN